MTAMGKEIRNKYDCQHTCVQTGDLPGGAEDYFG